jgi:hypothetical protein
VAVAVPNRASVSWLLLSGGRTVEVYLGGERTGGVFVTLPTGDLGRLIAGLCALRDGDPATDGVVASRDQVGELGRPQWTWPGPLTEADPGGGRPMRPPRPHDFATGPNVCITVPPGAAFVSRVSPDGRYGDLAIGAGVFLTLPRRGLDVLIAELDQVRHGAVNVGGIDPGSRWAPEPSQRSTNPTEPHIRDTTTTEP